VPQRARNVSESFQWICELLTVVVRQSEVLWRRWVDLSGTSLSKETRDNYDFLSNRMRPTGSEELRSLKEKSKSSLSLDLSKEFLYLPPLLDNEKFVPILSLECNLRSSPLKMSLHVLMYKSEPSSAFGPRLQGIGFRFEIHPDGAHDFWHVQICSKNGDQNLPGCPRWMPSKIPCIPVLASNPVSLIFCMLISFYGKGICNRLFSDINVPREYRETLKSILENQ